MPTSLSRAPRRAILHASTSSGRPAPRAKKKSGDPCIDFDIWVNAQDWKIKDLKIEQTTGGKDSASVKASFDNMGTKTVITFDLFKDKKGWVVDEVHTDCDTLTSVLNGEPSKC